MMPGRIALHPRASSSFHRAGDHGAEAFPMAPNPTSRLAPDDHGRPPRRSLFDAAELGSQIPEFQCPIT